MKCAWEAFMRLIPIRFRDSVDKLGRNSLQELRLRRGHPPELIRGEGSVTLPGEVTGEDIQFVINTACRYSPWTAETVVDGFISAPGGHRIGLCGEVTLRNGKMADIRQVTSLCIRIARDFSGIGAHAPKAGNLLILGRPGSGKTTLLRDIIRIRSDAGPGSVSVVDERGELFPVVQGRSCFPTGKRTDILTGCPKQQGILKLLRSMGPQTIAVDEITAREDCMALQEAMWCGVSLIATAHAGSLADFCSRPIYRPLLESRIFGTVLTMQPDKSWREERIRYDV